MSKENNVDTSNRDYHKAAADEAFRSKDIKKAIEEYTTAISFDPDWYILVHCTLWEDTMKLGMFISIY